MKEIVEILPHLVEKIWALIRRLLDARRARKRLEKGAKVDADFEKLKRAKTVEEKDAALDALDRNWNDRK